MAELFNIVKRLDTFLNTKNIPDYPNAYNGLQVENDGTVTCVGYAVDASLDAIKEAVDKGVDLLIVHHGLYWQGVEMLKGAWRTKCELLLKNNIAVYSSHLPLDVHPEVGNNVLLAKELGLKEVERCLPWKGIHIGVRGLFNGSVAELTQRVTEKLGQAPFVCARGEEQIGELVVIAGGGGSQIKAVFDSGERNFLSGEGSQWTVPYAEDNGMNFILANHYLTETFGVAALARLLQSEYDLTIADKILTENQL